MTGWLRRFSSEHDESLSSTSLQSSNKSSIITPTLSPKQIRRHHHQQQHNLLSTKWESTLRRFSLPYHHHGSNMDSSVIAARLLRVPTNCEPAVTGSLPDLVDEVLLETDGKIFWNSK